jgi:CRP/FNR family transcriptional regulator, cyclic AMP receptor protein
METLEPLLAEHAFFKGMSPEYVQTLVGCASNARFTAGETIVREGDHADKFFLVRSGRVAIELFVNGRGPVTVQTLDEGDVVGWSWLVAPYVWRFDARALELTRVIALDGACLRGKCDDDPKLGYELLKRFAYVMTERLQATRLQLLDMYGAQN